jgi:hypothetical protein
MRLRKPSPAMLVALLALFVALAGSSYAAFSLPRNSVGTRQLMNNAVTTQKVKNGTLRLQDFNASQRSVLRKDTAVAGATVGLDGTVQNWFNSRGGRPTITVLATGTYRVTFPGSSFDLSRNAIAFGEIMGNHGEISVSNSQGGMLVQTYRDGPSVNDNFMLVVFDATPNG